MKRRVVINPIEQRYLASCPMREERPRLEKAIKLAERLRHLSYKNEDVSIGVDEISIGFPRIARLFEEGLFDRMSMQEYFEGYGQDSHNMRNYLFAKRCVRKYMDGLHAAIIGVLKHIDDCCVKVARKDGRMWSYRGEVDDQPLDREYFGLGNADYYLVHNRSKRGHIAVREAEEEEINGLREWFRGRQHGRNPIFEYRDVLD